MCCGLAIAGLVGASVADGTIFRPGAHEMKHKAGVFRVSIKGVQVNRWSTDTQPRWECDVSAKGSGFERVRFHTPARRMRVVAFGEGRADSAVFKPLPVRGKVTRKGKLVTGSAESLPEHCLAGGGGGPPPEPRRSAGRNSRHSL